ncbi:hypothetical protein [Methyloversatilis sp.]|uniref:hypothetical protein n=1 Tax=Methyloversatilis sp. TaxID=2569862 RepID=UPI003D2C846C
MELITGQSVYYTNKEHLPVEDVAASLLALKAIIEATPEVLEKIAPGLHIQSVSVYVNEVRAGSLWEDLVVKFLWGSQENLTKNVEELRGSLKVDSLIENKLLVGCIIGALVMAGGIYLLNKLNGTKEQKEPLQNNLSVVINIGAQLAGVSEDQFSAAIHNAIKSKPSLTKEAVKVVRPAKREAGTSIVLNHDGASQIGNKAIQAMPLAVPGDDEEELIDDYQEVEIQIRAIDLDSTKRGWAAVVPSVNPKRAKMHLDPHIKLSDLLGKEFVTGDITVISKYDESGKKIPTLIFLRDVRK